MTDRGFAFTKPMRFRPYLIDFDLTEALVHDGPVHNLLPIYRHFPKGQPFPIEMRSRFLHAYVNRLRVLDTQSGQELAITLRPVRYNFVLTEQVRITQQRRP